MDAMEKKHKKTTVPHWHPNPPRNEKFQSFSLEEACVAFTDPVCEHCLNKEEEEEEEASSSSKAKNGEIVVQPLAWESQTLPVSEINAERKELVIIGAGPHGLALALRLLELDADLLTDKERHLRADFVQKMRPLSQVRRHIKDLIKGKSKMKPQQIRKNNSKDVWRASDNDDVFPPPVSLDFFHNHVLVVDASVSAEKEASTTTQSGIHGWMSGWTQNFHALNITQLRSPSSAHLDPLDHRSLEFYATHLHRDDELIPFTHVHKETSRWAFHGPYDAPSTKLFHDFHQTLIESYGLVDQVKPGKVTSITVWPPQCQDDDPWFQLLMEKECGTSHNIVWTKRVVCATGPIGKTNIDWFLEDLVLDPPPSDLTFFQSRILPAPALVPFVLDSHRSDDFGTHSVGKDVSVLIVGGGITSAHLALVLASEEECGWCTHVTLLQRSCMVSKQFDIDTVWMGPGRGKLLDQFWAKSLEERVAALKACRGGGSISPEVIDQLLLRHEGERISIHEEVKIVNVSRSEDRLLVTLDDGSKPQHFDMIWLATGFENNLDNCQLFSDILKTDQLPIDTVRGLPVLDSDLSWKQSSTLPKNEPEWKRRARKRLWLMGPLAGLELGPDALNLMGARHGAVRVATALRKDLTSSRDTSRNSFSIEQ
jgi:hypothetical protein